MAQAALRLLAPAKINLSLHVRGRLPDGYHDLESLVAFADIGDYLAITPAEAFGFDVGGVFADAVGTTDNLVRHAHAAFEAACGRALPCHMRLEKNLPVAAGLGGGSADAAAALVGLAQFFDVSLTAEEMQKIAAPLGADVPVCLAAQPCWMTGIGHDLSPLPALPEADIVLVNPRLGVPTGDIFKALAASSELTGPHAAPTHFADLDALLGFMAGQGNDLTAPAIKQAPLIADCLAALQEAGGHGVAMTGSGATCFALAEAGHGKAVGQAYAALRPQDWVADGRLINGR